MLATLLFSLLLVLSVQVSEQGACFHDHAHACGHASLDLDACLAQPYACKDTETSVQVMCSVISGDNSFGLLTVLYRISQSASGTVGYLLTSGSEIPVQFKDLFITSSLSECYQCDTTCRMHIANDGVHFNCHGDTMEKCKQEHEMLNPALCEPTLTQTDVQHASCSYCCDSAECLQNLVHQTTAAAATTTPRPNSPGMNSCFSTDCNPGDDIDTCRSGTWECEAGEFCQVHYSFSAKSFTMNCTKSTWLNFEECQQKLLNHHCSKTGGFTEHDCHFCCPDAHCVELIKDVETAPPKTTLPPCAPLQQTTPASQSNSSQSPSSGTPSLSTLLTSPPTSQAGTTSQDVSTSPSTSQTGCRDMLAGDCAAKYFDQCDNAVVRYHMCQLTCNACNETPPDTHLTTTPQGCRDMLAGDCAAKYFDQCDNAVVRYHMCQLTCNACNETPPDTHLTTTPQGTSPDTHVTTTPQGTTPTTSPKAAGQCADCYGLDCLLSDPSKPCPGEKPFCMTIVQETSHGRDIKRVCADQQDCDSITLTSDCHLVEDKILAGVTCEYCCNEPDCNAPPDLVPKKGLMTQHPKP